MIERAPAQRFGAMCAEDGCSTTAAPGLEWCEAHLEDGWEWCEPRLENSVAEPGQACRVSRQHPDREAGLGGNRRCAGPGARHRAPRPVRAGPRVMPSGHRGSGRCRLRRMVSIPARMGTPTGRLGPPRTGGLTPAGTDCQGPPVSHQPAERCEGAPPTTTAGGFGCR